MVKAFCVSLSAAFDQGMNPHVYVTYRHIVGGVVVLPFAYFLEKKTRPKMTSAMFVEIFLFSLLGVGLTVNMYFASLKYTSAAFVSATVNTIPSLTFILAIIVRQEVLNIRDTRGLAKVLGTVISLAGVMTLTLYRGHAIRSLWNSSIHISKNNGLMLRRYPAQLSLATWTNLLGAAQSAVFTAVIIRHEPESWSSTSLVDVGSILFSGVVSSGFNTSMLIWCTKEKGPVFTTMFCPLQTLLVVVFSYFILGDRLYIGSIIGGAVIIIGLYLLLWGKGGDQDKCIMESQEKPNLPKDVHNVTDLKTMTVEGRDIP
ncbi:WAT1-related protein [Drosera capensis]